MKTELSGNALAEIGRGLTDTSRGASAEEQDAWARQLAAMLGGGTKVVAQLPNFGSNPNDGQPAHKAPALATGNQGVEPQNSDAEGDKRLTLTISTEALGEVDIIIDRAEGGVRVVLGVQARAAESALMPEKMALTRALMALGLTVHSVNVVRQNELGTVPAQASVAREATGDTDTVDPRSKVSLFTEAARNRKRGKRIDVLG